MTNSTSDKGTALPPAIDAPEELYNEIMQRIEPDLTTYNVPLLQEKYKDEPEEERKKRETWYAEAFRKFAEAYEKKREERSSSIRTFGRTLTQHVEGHSRSKEEHALDELSSAISNL